jgi:NADPH-dependent 2,4-dienoyl-CoA reductase/sulfur reductase-like enzyme
MNARFHILIVGAGPAGIAAAVRASESGAKVAIIDDNPAPGGQIWRRGAPQLTTARRWFRRFEAATVERLQGWRVFDAPEPGLLLAERSGLAPEAASCTELRYDKLILATGARERFLPFPGWTLPNVMGTGGLDALVRGGLPIEGKRVLVAGSGPLLLAVAAELAERGAHVVGVFEQAPLPRLLSFGLHLSGQPAKLIQGFRLRLATRGVPIFTGCWPVAAHGAGKLGSVTVRRGTRQWQIPCDYLACGFHLVPNLELPMLLGCRVEDGFVSTDDFQTTSTPNVYCAGEPTGIGGVERALIEGEIAGLAAAGQLGEARNLRRTHRATNKFVRALQQAFALEPRLRELPEPDTVVCRCEDVPFAALREHHSWRDAKLLTRCGMGPCQARICGAATAFLFGWAQDSVRPPLLPARIASLSACGAAQSNPHGKDAL